MGLKRSKSANNGNFRKVRNRPSQYLSFKTLEEKFDQEMPKL